MTPDFPSQSPLYHAANADRYDRQEAIRAYEQKFGCCLIVMIDAIFQPSVTQFEDLIYDADPAVDLHLLLNSPGGEGETAIRLVRAAQARCRELTVIIPDHAKSAATLLALGAHHILMSPMSDLGPIDPQFLGEDGLVAAKDIIAAVDNAAQKVQEAPGDLSLVCLVAQRRIVHYAATGKGCSGQRCGFVAGSPQQQPGPFSSRGNGFEQYSDGAANQPSPHPFGPFQRPQRHSRRFARPGS